MIPSKEIRKQFLNFFKEKDHAIIPSSSVVPYEDPTLLFTNAGMNQFKDVFLGLGTREYKRVADTQKCIRAGGKHNDLEEVGVDGYHHTFFEMLGNWSFGDYYKKEAIGWAWELLTKVWKLPKDRLWATVYKTDDEALEFWKSETDIEHSHILRFGEKDNFWEMGETGPCGPCSEVHFDLTENGCKAEDVNAGLEEVIEIWNLVFIQYNRDEKGELHPLPSKHVDTGMGFERIVRVINNKKSNYDTDIFIPIINDITRITGTKYEGENISSINAIADHVRALTFAICDGAMPSNEGRGYVLRRILRRASRLARKINYTEPIVYELVDSVVNIFADVFPELSDRKDFIKNVIKSEEESFNITLDRGLEHFYDVYEKIKDKKEKIFPGEDAFMLYDTYGFPIDLTQLIAREHGFEIDMKKFDEEMGKQKDRARAARKDDVILASTKGFELDEKIKKYNPDYNPYDLNKEGVKTNLLKVERIANSDLEVLVLKNNPFYSESGGQISDTGKLVFSDGYELDVIDSQNNYYVYVKNIDHKSIFHKEVIAKVDYRRRKAIQRNHSATHLLHEALRQVLGSHIKQMGSLVTSDYLRFDFPHFKKLEAGQIIAIEDLVNSKIQEAIEVQTLADISIEEANKIPNVKKFFGEKYGSKVRVVTMDEKFSIEFCGGTHVDNTSDIGLFKIVKEESISSGVRRIFAKTGEGILELLDENVGKIEMIISELPEKIEKNFLIATNEIRIGIREADFKDISFLKLMLQHQGNMLKSLNEVREKYIEEKKQLEKKMLKQNLGKIFEKMEEMINNSSVHNGHRIAAFKFDIGSTDEFKEIGDMLREKILDGVGLIASVINGKINLVCSVSDNLIKEKNMSAGKLISTVAKELGGGGGGRPQLATAGGKDIDKLDSV
ncbi:MAG: alanine--tRNA ligase, partial [Ignavibacteria bacterium]